MSCFYLKLDSIASSVSEEDAVRELADISRCLGIVCHADVNDIEVIAYPHFNAENLVLGYRKAKEIGANWCSAFEGL